MKKTMTLVLISIIIFSSMAYAVRVGGVAGEYFHSDVKAYINGKAIDSWNADGKTLIYMEDLKDYGFNVEWNEERQVIKANFDAQPLVLKEIAEPLYEGEHTDWIKSTVPNMTAVATIHGNADSLNVESVDELTIKFAKKMSSYFMTSEYFPVMQDNKNVSDKFKYTYNEKYNTLTIKLVNHDVNIDTELGSYGAYTKNSKGSEFNFYMLKGIPTEDEEERLPITLRVKARMLWEVEE